MTTDHHSDSESAKILKDIRTLLVGVVIFGILGCAVWALIASQHESEEASRHQGAREVLRGR
jgi:hypothetical protein